MGEEELNRRKTICALHGWEYEVTVAGHWIVRSGGVRLLLGWRSRPFDEVVAQLAEQN